MKFEVSMIDIYMDKIEEDIKSCRYFLYNKNYLLSNIKYFKDKKCEFALFVVKLVKKLNLEYREGETESNLEYYLSEYPEDIVKIKNDFLKYGFRSETDFEIYAIWMGYSESLDAYWLCSLYNPFLECLGYLFDEFYKLQKTQKYTRRMLTEMKGK